jgi:hypothetical protein
VALPWASAAPIMEAGPTRISPFAAPPPQMGYQQYQAPNAAAAPQQPYLQSQGHMAQR